jgi:hypothetical protein
MSELLCIDIMVRIDLVCGRSRNPHLLTTIFALPTDLGGQVVHDVSILEWMLTQQRL